MDKLGSVEFFIDGDDLVARGFFKVFGKLGRGANTDPGGVVFQLAAPPTVSGDYIVGGRAVVVPGTYNFAPARSYICFVGGVNVGALESYDFTTVDEGLYIFFRETAVFEGQTIITDTDLFGPVQAVEVNPPVDPPPEPYRINTTAAFISYTTDVGGTPLNQRLAAIEVAHSAIYDLVVIEAQRRNYPL